MINRKWFDPRGSMEAFSKKYRLNHGVMTFAERLEGIYRFVTGRLNTPGYTDDNNVTKLSKNHAGLYDYLTLGILNAVESFLRGNWIQTPSRRNIFGAITAIIWFPLNLARAAVGAVVTALAIIPAAIYQSVQVNNAGLRAVEEAAVAGKAMDALKHDNAEREAAAPTATEKETTKNTKSLLSRFKKTDAPSQSSEGTTKVVLKAIDKASDFAELESHPNNTPTSFWKNEGQEKDGTYVFRLRNADGNDPVMNIDRYHAVYSSTSDVGLFSTRAHAVLGNGKKGVANTTKLNLPVASGSGDLLISTPINGITNAKVNVYVPARVR